MTPSGSRRSTRSRRPGAAGVAPEKSSTTPDRNVTAASRRGDPRSVSRPSHAPARATCARRCRGLVGHEHDDGHDERQQVVDRAVDDERRQQIAAP